MEFVQLVAAGLGPKTREAILEKVDPVTLGDVACARYAIKKKYAHKGKNFTGEREVIKVLRGGRLYTIILDVLPNQLPEYRGDAYAVVAGMEFLAAADDSASEGGDDTDEGDETSADAEDA